VGFCESDTWSLRAEESKHESIAMGYGGHITRAEHWAENEGHDIAPDEWVVLFQSDPESIPTPENGEHFVVWYGAATYPQTWFDCRAGNQLTTSIPLSLSLVLLSSAGTTLKKRFVRST
jgi:hypothetical protein